MKIIILISVSAGILHAIITELGNYADEINPHNKNRDL